MPRAVVAHRNAWFRGKLVDGLAAHGVRVVALFKDGADAAGVAIVEQAEIVLVEDLLPSLCGLEVVRRVCDYAPRTLVAAHSADDTALQDYVTAGARAVFTRRLPPADVVAGLVGGLHR